MVIADGYRRYRSQVSRECFPACAISLPRGAVVSEKRAPVLRERLRGLDCDEGSAVPALPLLNRDPDRLHEKLWVATAMMTARFVHRRGIR